MLIIENPQQLSPQRVQLIFITSIIEISAQSHIAIKRPDISYEDKLNLKIGINEKRLSTEASNYF
jgi:hypothetical protein